MKSIRSWLLIFLAIALVTGAMQGPAAASPLKNVNQICHIYYDNASSSWKRIMPDGTIQAFALSPGQSFILTGVYVRFYADTPNTGPYRFYLMANTTRLWIENLSNVYSDATTVYGGAISDTIDPGVSFSVLPTMQVRQLPQPPADPNSGPIVTGTFYDHFVGYVAP
jgi:hypothetical protein